MNDVTSLRYASKTKHLPWLCISQANSRLTGCSLTPELPFVSAGLQGSLKLLNPTLQLLAASQSLTKRHEGTIACFSQCIGSEAVVALLACQETERGRVVGSIRGLSVTLQAQSHVEGDIIHQSLAIEQGAYFEGKSRRSDNPLEEVKASSAGGPRSVHKPSDLDSKRRAPPN
jgi:hypothetical protein